MQATAYEGYFDNGCFYTSGTAMKIPEKCRIVIAILEDSQDTETNKQIASVPNSKLQFDFVTDVPPLPDSFFDPLPEEELELWGL
ncbi:MAG: hypothetical protein FWC55_06015 [Firmicutes bacterium]|nr:hypothetical protein [Bacillota bacterium]